jgi:hypothetical protein
MELAKAEKTSARGAFQKDEDPWDEGFPERLVLLLAVHFVDDANDRWRDSLESLDVVEG